MSLKKIPCPCGRKHQNQLLSFDKCCARYLNQFAQHPAPDAESLMRSRYCAFVHAREDYLKATWFAENRPLTIEFDPCVKWLGLEVKRHHQLDTSHAEVEFVARSRLKGRANRLHEISHFVKTNDRWFYVDGVLCSI